MPPTGAARRLAKPPEAGNAAPSVPSWDKGQRRLYHRRARTLRLRDGHFRFACIGNSHARRPLERVEPQAAVPARQARATVTILPARSNPSRAQVFTEPKVMVSPLPLAGTLTWALLNV